jgi:hypothetical protein
MAKLTKKQIEYREKQATNKAQLLILNEMDKCMDLIEQHFKNYCTTVSMEHFGQVATSVPMVYISQSIKIIKQGYRDGALNPKQVEELTEKPKENVSEMP